MWSQYWSCNLLRWKCYKASSLLFKEAFEYAHLEALLLGMGGTAGDSGVQGYRTDGIFWTRVQGVKQRWYT